MKQAFTIDTGLIPSRENSLLSLRIGDNHAGFAITDLETGALQQLAWYTGQEVTAVALDELLEQHAHFNNHYHRFQVCYDRPQGLLIPLAKYQEEHTRGLLQTVYGVTDYDQVYTDTVASWQLHVGYAVPKEIHQWVNTNFAGAERYHQYSVAIRNIDIGNEQGHFLVDFRDSEFTLLVCKTSDLMLAQSYTYSTPADVIYYLVKACQQFELQPEQVRVSLSGMIDRQSILFRELYQYFIQIEFKEATWALAQPDADATRYPAHFFTSLNDLARCAS